MTTEINNKYPSQKTKWLLHEIQCRISDRELEVASQLHIASSEPEINTAAR
jgi:hypothetical protein